jgi:hypothetical protein
MKKLFFLPILILTLGLSGCSEEEAATYRFTIFVTTPEGFPVQNATVKVDAPVAPDRLIPDFEARTNLHGEVTFNYTYDAVLKIRAIRSFDGIVPDWIGCGFVKLSPNEHVRARVVVRPFNPNIGGC